MPPPDDLAPRPRSVEASPNEVVSLSSSLTESQRRNPDEGSEHALYYAIIVVVLLLGAVVLGRLPASAPPLEPLEDRLRDGSTAHSVMESVATVLAFIIGSLALVRYYSRKQVTFLLVGCGFLGAAILDLNHAIGSAPDILLRRITEDPRIDPSAFDSWGWMASRSFLSFFLLASFVAWSQEMKQGSAEWFQETSTYLTAIGVTVTYVVFFNVIPLQPVGSPDWWIPRPLEFVPAVVFLLTFIGFYRKGTWRRDLLEHWILVSLLMAVVLHGAYMAFAPHRWSALFDAAHLLKVASYGAILTGLLSSVYTTFIREAEVLEALTKTNDALAREVESRTQTEQAVKESSERLQRFLDNANDLIQSVNSEGRFLYVNSSWKRVLGYTDAELERLKLFDIVDKGHRGALDAELKRIANGGEPRRFNTEYVAADGRIVVLSGSTQAQTIRGRVVATQSILRDVTEQRLAERRLDASQRNLEALVENTGDSIWSVDRQHRMITLNSAFKLALEARIGREPRVGQQPHELFTEPDDVEWYQDLYAKTLRGERSVAARSDYVDGQLRHFEVFANPIHSLEGVSGAVFFGKDVTQRVLSEEAIRVAKDEAEAANKAKSDFLANMSHELRTPLNSVIGFTNILLKNKDDRLTEKDLGFLKRVLSNGKHLLALINEVLDLAKVEAGRMELIIEEVDLAELCVETVQQLEGQAKAKDGAVALVADVPERVELVETDSAKLKQVIINLVGNALKFTEAGSVTVRLEMSADGVTPVAIAVEDTGIGIPEDRLGAIFEAFKQAEVGTSRKYGGTGLGLALSRSICLLMGYDLLVESVMGEGSTFRIVMGERATPTLRNDPEEAIAIKVPDPVPEVALSSADAAPSPLDVGARTGAPNHVESGDVAPPAVSDTEVKEVAPAQPTDPSPDDPSKADSPPAASEEAGSGPWSDFKVLVVDDEASARVLITHYLKDFGCRVLAAGTGEEALALAERERPDLITLDLLMPGMSGWDVLREVKSHPTLRHIPVVIASVISKEGRGRLLGAVDFIAKPFEREDLLRVLWRHLSRKRRPRILLMVGNPELREHLAATIALRGLETIHSPGEDVLAAVGREAPDAVVLDLGLPSAQGVAGLLELREDRVHTGIPLLTVVPTSFNPRQLEIVKELSTVYGGVSQAEQELTRLLDATFPIAEVLAGDE